MNIDVAKEWIQDEKNMWAEDYTNITFSINDIMEFEEGTDIKNRYFVKNINILDKYMRMLDEASSKLNVKKKVLFFEVNNTSSSEASDIISELMEYKDKYKEVLYKLKYCAKCQCLKCIKKCRYDSCNSCDKSGKVTECNYDKYNVIMFNNFLANLYNSETNSYDEVKVLCEIDILEKDTVYRVIDSNGEYLILTYSHDPLKGDSYGSVDDKDVFNLIANLYEKNVQNLL
ncbi:hypothetical protein [Clostridium baratii]|uniref:hypothetical protein n=1 Tax=Clostridium baratii TaxID=1561 RepID=UPI0030DE515E